MQNPAGKVYAENINNGDVASVHQGILNARDKRQIKNLATIQRKKFRVSHDELYGSLQLAYHINDFVKLMSVFPDIRIILGSKDILSELNTLLTVKSDEPVLLSYDTTFNVGDYFVSVLVFRHVLFKNGVTIPAAFLIHDRKNQRTHDDFFRILSDEVPNLKKGQHVIVTDRERVFTNAINKYLPNLKQVFCWNHIRRDLRYWLRNTRSKSRNVDDVGTCSKQLFELMQCESLVAFEELEGEFKADWSPELVEYFDTKLRSDILGHSCRWLLEEFNVYDPYSGVTNNMSEGTNNVIEGLQNWHGAPLDAIVLSMHYLQKFKYNEIIRGRLNKGNFRLKSMHQNASLSPEDVDMPNDVCDPLKIIDLVKGDINALSLEESSEPELPLDATESVSNGASEQTVDDPGSEHKAAEPFNNQKSLAVDAIGQRKVVLVAETGCFIVEGSKGDKYAVTLAPNEKCHCPALGTCYHILAARRAVGLDDRPETVTCNMAELIKGSRKRPNRLPGRKIPRPIDRQDLNESTIRPDSVLEISEHYSSTPASKRKRVPPVTPKSILKRKCQDDNLSSSKRSKQTKKLRLALPKTKKRKSLIEAFSDASIEHRDDSSGVNDSPNGLNENDSASEPNQLIDVTNCKSPVSVFENFDQLSSKNNETIDKIGISKELKTSIKEERNEIKQDSDDVTIIVSDSKSPEKDNQENKKSKRIWRTLPDKKYSLGFCDKNEIKHDKKINSDIINFSQGLLRRQFPDINGFQNCGYVPVKKNDTWKYGLKMKQVSAPCAQVHHTGNDHWLVSFQDESPCDIYVADSMNNGSSELSTCVDMQFLQMYGRKKLNVSILKVQQQSNNVDCGIFAIAFCTEFCYTGRKGVLQAEFDRLKMRDHLLNCLENMELTPFPKLKRKLRLKKQAEQIFNYSISADCAAMCDYPNSFNDMVQCDTKDCQKWYHYTCAGLNSPTDSLLWVCKECRK